MTAQESDTPVSVESAQDGVATVRISTGRLNLLNQAVRKGLGDFFVSAAEDPSIRAVVLASGENNFCAGANLHEIPLRYDRRIARAHGENAHRMILNLVNCGKPVVAAIEGACMGGGMELALACDFRVASRDATLGLPEVNRGLFPGTGGCALLARIVGPVRAKALLLEGATLGAPHWFELGVVNHIAEPGNALAAASEWAQRLAHKPLAATRAIRRMIDHQFIASFAAHLQIELAEYVESFQAADAREGVEAFLEKRAPVWTHR